VWRNRSAKSSSTCETRRCSASLPIWSRAAESAYHFRPSEGQHAVMNEPADITVIDGLFGDLMAASTPYLNADERAEVQHFIDQAEYGVALETFVHVFVEGGKSATPQVFALITRLTGMMQMRLDDTLEKIPRLPS
jgi:hypothetical protein